MMQNLKVSSKDHPWLDSVIFTKSFNTPLCSGLDWIESIYQELPRGSIWHTTAISFYKGDHVMKNS